MRDFSEFKKVVVKVGTNLITKDNGIDEARIVDLCRQIAALRNKGYQVILVSSGAVGLGAKELGHGKKIAYIPMRQACAAIGNPILMSYYRKAFGIYDTICAQVLLTRRDLNNRTTYNNLRASVSTLLALGVVPVFNENDVVANTNEIGEIFGDNDRMSAMIASKIDADLLILLTDIDGVYTANPKSDENAVFIPEIEHVDREIMGYAKGAGSTFSTGGMKTKLMAAQIASMALCGTIIASGYERDSLIRIMEGEQVGTYIHPEKKLTQRQRWIINNSHVGSIMVDRGAVGALKAKKSLLPSGVVGVVGVFEAGDVVAIMDTDGKVFAKAVPYFNSTDIALMKGLSTQEAAKAVSRAHIDCLFRPEDLVLTDAQSL